MDLTPDVVEPIVRRLLREDLGHGDLTTAAVVSPGRQATVVVVADEAGVMCGHLVAETAYRMVDPAVRYEPKVAEGSDFAVGERLAEVHGPARALLSAEETVLGILGRMCGVATAARRLSHLVAGTRTRVADTRKTLPGLRVLDRYAVRVGGGVNHRFGLDDGILIKDNHIALARGVAAAMAAARAAAPTVAVRVEVEVENLVQLDEALAAGADVILLDNMDTTALAQAVARTAGRAVLEASGGITASRVPEIAATGVDFLSTGSMTHSAASLALRAELVRVT